LPVPNRRLRWLAFLPAFSSVWCYFSALISILPIWIIRDASPPIAWP
jgi:hypothetical protein